MEKDIFLESLNPVPYCGVCEEEKSYAKSFKFLVPDFSTYKVRVIRLENEFSNIEKLYRIKAVIKWKCPSCGLSLSDIATIKEIPVKILNEICGKCSDCGKNMELQNEHVIMYSHDVFTDIIELTGEMVCRTCQSELPFSKKLTIKFKHIWKFINKIERIEIGKDGLRFERGIRSDNKK